MPLSVYSEVNIELAGLYLDEALLSYDHENYELAEKNLDKSMSFSKNISESWFLYGLLKEDQGNRLKALDFYEQCLTMAEVYDPFYRELQYRYVRLLNITGRYKKVLDYYSTHEQEINTDSSSLLIVADSFYRYGLVQSSLEIARDIYMKDPNNLTALIYMIRTSVDGQFYNYLENNIDNFEIDSNDEILFRKIILTSGKSKKVNLVRIYNEIFGDTLFFDFLENSGNPSIDTSRNLLIRSSGNNILSDGVYFADYNFDGTSDEIISVVGDQMTYMKDGNQDNITDLSINLTKNIPENIYITADDISYEISYSEYPLVDEILYSNRSMKRIYKVYPGTKYTPIADLDNFNWKYDVKRDAYSEAVLLTPLELLKISYMFDEYLPQEQEIFRKYLVKNGEIYHIKEDSQSDGFFDHFLTVSAWLPETGYRDINNDGKIDIFEYYENGKLIGIAVDWDNNGKSEYLEDWSLLDIKTWDFNEDSYFDAEYISSRVNGSLYQLPVDSDPVHKYDIYSWDFSNENFWFTNN